MKRTDLTLGPVAPGLLRFAFPPLLGTLVQQLYNTVDLIFVGHVIDSSASAAIGASTLLITCLIGFFGGMAVGAGVVIAQSFGERNPGKLDRAIHSTAALALAGGICLALLGWLLAPGYLRLIRTPDEIRAALLFVTVPLTRSIKTVAAAYPVTWGLTALCMCAYYLSVNGTIKRETEP